MILPDRPEVIVSMMTGEQRGRWLASMYPDMDPVEMADPAFVLRAIRDIEARCDPGRLDRILDRQDEQLAKERAAASSWAVWPAKSAAIAVRGSSYKASEPLPFAALPWTATARLCTTASNMLVMSSTSLWSKLPPAAVRSALLPHRSPTGRSKGA